MSARAGAWHGKRYFGALLLLFMPVFAWGILGAPGAYSRSGTPGRPTVSDSGVLTTWNLPPNRGPWQMKWDTSRNVMWFAEGNHSDPPLDQIGSINPATNVLMEWGVPTGYAYVHGTFLDRANDLWFTEVRMNKIARFQPDVNTFTEWTLAQTAFAHGITVDDITPGSTTVWFTEREDNSLGSLDPATGQYWRHFDPSGFGHPHGVTVAPDHSVWFVETCGNRVGQLIPGATETWNFWQPPTTVASCGPPNGVGPLFGFLSNGSFWYSEPYNGNLIRLDPAQNRFTIWRVLNSGGGGKLVTQTNPDPDGNIFFTEMNNNRLGRLEPQGATTPTVVVITPITYNQPAPPQFTAVPATAVYTPMVTQLTPVTQVVTGTRTGGVVEWNLPRATASPGRYIGPGRGWYGDGGFWASLVTANQVVRISPFSSVTPTFTPSGSTPTRTSSPTVSPIATCEPGLGVTQSLSPGSSNNRFYGVAALSPDDVWAVGVTDNSPLVEHWDGARWTLSPLPAIPGATLKAVSAASARDVWAVGRASGKTVTVHWNGSDWARIPSPDADAGYNTLNGVAAIAHDDVWAVGASGSVPHQRALTLHWDGRAWNPVDVPNPVASTSLNGVAATSANDVWAVGAASDPASGQSRSLVLHWDGQTWTESSVPQSAGPTSALYGVSALPTGEAWAVGYASVDGTAAVRALTLYRDAGGWRIVNIPNSGKLENKLYAVVAISRDDAWAVGDYQSRPSDPPHSLLARWDGSAWSLQGNAISANTGGDYLYAVDAAPNGDAWATGHLAGISNALPRTLALRHVEVPCNSPTPTRTPTSTPTIPVTATSTGTATPTIIGATATPTTPPTTIASATTATTSTPCPITFSDVHPSDYFYVPVQYLYCRGVISGYADNTFRPYNNTTRGQLSKIIVLAEGWTQTCTTQHFTDVPPSDPFFCYIETAFAHNIISGYADGTFKPGNNVTRGQLSKIVVLAEGWADDCANQHFSDVSPSHPFYCYIETAFAHGIITGYADGTFRPGNNATRGQICKIVYQAITQ